MFLMKEGTYMNIEFANRLQKLRKEKGYSQDQLAEALGVSRQSISKWERAEASPDSDNLIALAKLYNISLDELISPSDSKDSQEQDSKKDDVRININGIEVNDKNGNHVHVGWDGIHVHDNKENTHVDISAKGFYVNQKKLSRKTLIIRDTLNLITIFLCIIAYIVIGTTMHLWHPTWIIFFAIPLVASIIEAIINRNPSNFAYPILVVTAYLLVGFLTDLWHPYWFLFLTIPLFYIITSLIDKIKKDNENYVIDAEIKNDEDEDEDEDNEENED